MIYDIKLENAQLHISKGNSKLGKGIYSFSTLPGNAEHLLYMKDGRLLTNIPGTCSRYCEHCAKDGACYAWRDAKLHHNAVIKAWAENTLLLRSNAKGLFQQIQDFIKNKNKKYYETNNPEDLRVVTWRWNVSGEIENVEELELMNEVATNCPEVQFGIYTKNFDALEEYLKDHGETSIANNFVINVSEWHGVAKDFIEKHPNIFNVFEYDDSNESSCELPEEEKDRLKKVTHCPAVSPNGKHAVNAKGEPITCDMCKRCYTKTGKRTAVYSH